MEKHTMQNIVGNSARMLEIDDLVEAIAETNATVLVTGESGTGKSMLAREIHARSNRNDQPFVEVACGALSETLLESELFGHTNGAFTGAIAEKMGKFAQADGGTIFLDEIATASPAMQVKMLRVLQEYEFEPVGSMQTQKVNARVILATNEDLSTCVAQGRFRQDLFYRINVIEIAMPPLRERNEDIPRLVSHFATKVIAQNNKQTMGFSPEAIATLQAYAWPGNIRELQNVVERAVLLSKSSVIAKKDLPTTISGNAADKMLATQQMLAPQPTQAPSATPTEAISPPEHLLTQTLKEALEGPEREIIRQVLELHHGNRNHTADSLGINRTTLYKKMKKLGLEV